MGAPKPTLGYPSKSAAAVALRIRGLPRREIAEKLCVTTNTVSGLLAAADSLAHGGRVRISQETLRALAGPAARRGLPPAELARRLLRVVASDQLVDAILDDGEGGT